MELGKGELQNVEKDAVVSPSETYPFQPPDDIPDLSDNFSLRDFLSNLFGEDAGSDPAPAGPAHAGPAPPGPAPVRPASTRKKQQGIIFSTPIDSVPPTPTPPVPCVPAVCPLHPDQSELIVSKFVRTAW